jgi:streptogramin lyase
MVDRIDPATGEVIAQIRAGLPDNSQMTGYPNVWGIAYGHDAVWVTASREQAILRINPATNEIADTIYVDGHVASIVATDDAIWAGSYDEAIILRIDPNSQATVETIPVPASARTMLAIGDVLWVLTRDAQLSRIDTATNSVQSSVPGGANACSCGVPLAGDGSGLWTVAFNGAVNHLDPTSGSSIALLDPISGDPVEVVIVGEEVWVVLADDGGTGHLERVDPATNTVVARGPTFNLTPESRSGLYVDVAVDGDTLWIVNSLDTVVAIDPTP